MGDLGPSYKIIFLIHKHKNMTEKKILDSFSNQELIFGRLKYLTNQGLIKKNNSCYSILPKGKLIYKLISNYRQILNWPLGG
jgi:predicted transcriptional regulator